ncbi:MAG: sugar transferase [Carboxylicivirga sp.]|jgi:lipopolysaccharide/colanic/teichoic acid biosynthesis glycosyltransferase|nr:sugar transferase [Carboxylicivirga sp.]
MRNIAMLGKNWGEGVCSMRSVREHLIDVAGGDVYFFIAQNIVLDKANIQILPAQHSNILLKVREKKIQSIVDLNPLNPQNDYLYNLSNCIPDSGLYIGCSFINEHGFDELNKKAGQTKSNTGRSRAEVLGRVAQAGFEIIEHRFINGLFYYAAIKVRQAEIRKVDKGLFITLKRVGYFKKRINIYKFRTMHPYSEYLQDYVVRLNGYNAYGKPSGDFRLTRLGKFFRKYWLDELPQLFNLMKGELGLIGVRPLSLTRFNELPEDVKQNRINFKPGCIPPYVALNMPDSKENIEAERIYMAAKIKSPILTDIRYFFMALYNIFSGKIRSS